MKIELRHLRHVVAAGESGSFRRAAKELNMSESALSRSVRNLEDKIGVALFVRYPTGVSLTDAGRSFIARARVALAQVERATQDAGSFGRGEIGILRIGVYSSIASGFAWNLLRDYLTASPAVHAEITAGSPSEHKIAVQQHQLDIAFLTGIHEVDGCESQYLWNERVMVALPRADSLATKREIDWRALEGRRFIVSESEPGPEIYDYIVKHLGDLGRHPSIVRQSVGRDNLLPLVALGQGLTLVSEAAKGARFRGVAYRPIRGALLPFSAIWSVKNDNPALRRFLSLARTMSRSALASILILSVFPI